MNRVAMRPMLAGAAAVALLLAGAVTAGDASAASTAYEAEQATVFHGFVERDHAGFTGTGFVNYANETGSHVEWAVPSGPAGSATLTFRYANGTTAARPMAISVNGTAVATLAFAPTGSWTTWRTVSATAGLTAAADTVRATATTAAGGPNVDSLTVDDATAVTDLSVAVVESAMSLQDATINSRWTYPSALFLYGEYLVYKRTGDRRYLDYVRRYVDRYVDANGRLNAPLETLDNMRGGTLLVRLYAETGDVRYRTAATQIRNRLSTYPRTTDGGFHHFVSSPNQLWADGVYMVNPFLADYGTVIGDRAYAYDEAGRQLEIYHSHLARPDGLLWHAYDQTRTASWADRSTGTSPESWCRAIGWFGMAAVDILEVLPADHPRRAALVTIVRNLAKAYATYQDPATGRWFQVVDKGAQPDNWTETSCSSMYTYMLSRGVQRGYLDAAYEAVARKGYAGVLAKVSVTPAGVASVADISEGTSVGLYPYYVGRARRTNDLHGLGAFLIMNEQLRATGG